MSRPASLTDHAAEVTARLREEEPPLGLDLSEAICPRCSHAYLVAAGSWGVCRDCLGEALVRLSNDDLLTP